MGLIHVIETKEFSPVRPSRIPSRTSYRMSGILIIHRLSTHLLNNPQTEHLAEN